ncbi:hypothetical protein JVU11DRAFT_9528 [Chiua virens]|nr:hypothetical protein JVU11DRAFT_9528 [Chiua virens]
MAFFSRANTQASKLRTVSSAGTDEQFSKEEPDSDSDSFVTYTRKPRDHGAGRQRCSSSAGDPGDSRPSKRSHADSPSDDEGIQAGVEYVYAPGTSAKGAGSVDGYALSYAPRTVGCPEQGPVLHCKIRKESCSVFRNRDRDTYRLVKRSDNMSDNATLPFKRQRVFAAASPPASKAVVRVSGTQPRTAPFEPPSGKRGWAREQQAEPEPELELAIKLSSPSSLSLQNTNTVRNMSAIVPSTATVTRTVSASMGIAANPAASGTSIQTPLATRVFVDSGVGTNDRGLERQHGTQQSAFLRGLLTIIQGAIQMHEAHP